ncbi:MAG: ribonuclease III [Myxococcales bacterium]|nr:ribonuclease III [Myxococcales bacterium]
MSVHPFQDPSLLQTALTHGSYAAEHGVVSNQRLEFLGDAVLKMLVAELLYRAFPDWPEGSLSTTLGFLVGNAHIGGLALELGLADDLRVGRGAALTGDRRRLNVLADAFEAVIGAVYEDGGLDAVRASFGPIFAERIATLAVPIGNYKSSLQEREAKAKRSLPEYRIVGTEGKDHDKLWLVQLRLGEETFGPVRGKSKRAAETELARLALGAMPVT